jgi:hypothetical protein
MSTSKSILKRLEQLEAEADPVQLCFVHELRHSERATEVRYLGTNIRGHYLWEVPKHLKKDSFGRILDERFDAALSEEFKNQGRVIPLHIIGTPE